jgi:very-short-patch-repair endonuclease
MKKAQDTLCRYNKSLQPFANKLRKEMTKAEACLWKYVLRAGQMKGYSFRRQRPVLKYIADFMCKEIQLVIEVDGITHDTKQAQDRRKTEELEQAGFLVLRFTDEEVLTNIGGLQVKLNRLSGRSNEVLFFRGVCRTEPPRHFAAPPPAGEKRSSLLKKGRGLSPSWRG